ncbi:MAG: T9SS type A sorting domain-containing protein [Bacteroidota bacterium]
MAQPTLSKSFSANTIGPGSVSTITFTINNGSASPVTDLAFTDVLPLVPGPMTIADPAIASTTCLNGVVNAPAGGGTITFSGGELGAFQSCTVIVHVTASTPGVHTNPAVTLTSSAGSSMSLPRDLTVVTTLAGFSKSFAPSTVDLGEVSTLTFTIDNSLNAGVVANVEFMDNLPSGMVIADPPNAFTDCVSASAPATELTAVPGSTVIELDADGNSIFPGFEVLPAGASCTVTVDVLSTGTGDLDNISDDLLSDFTFSGKAVDRLTVLREDPIHIQKSFTNDPAVPGGTVELEINITNFDRSSSASNVNFTDDLTTALAGLTASNLLENTCGGSVSGIGTTSIGLSGGSIGAGGSCKIRIECTLPMGATPGEYTNTTSAVNATIGGNMESGNPASGKLFVSFAPSITKFFTNDPVAPGGTVDLEFTITNTDPTNMLTDIAFIDELTAPGLGLPFPLLVTLPPTPDPPCGAGSSLGFVFPDTDRQALSLTGGNIGAGGSCTFTVTIEVPGGFPGGTYINTTSEITGTLNGAQVTGPPAADDLEVLSTPSIAKTFSSNIVQPGGQVDVTFDLSMPETATLDATNISFSDNLDVFLSGTVVANPNNLNNTCGGTVNASAGSNSIDVSGIDLMPGGACSITVTLQIPAAASQGVSVNSTTPVTATSGGETVTGDPASASLTIAGLTLSKTFIPDIAVPGQAIQLQFDLDNTASTLDATNIDFDLSLFPLGIEVTTASPLNICGGTVMITTVPTLGSFIDVSGMNVTAGNACSFTLDLQLPDNIDEGDNICQIFGATASIGGGPVGLPPFDDILLIDPVIMEFSKEFTDDPVFPGDDVNLSFTIENISAENAITDITFTDDIGAILPGATFNGLPKAACGGTLDENPAGVLELTGASLPISGNCSFDVSITTPGAVGASNIINTTSPVTGKVGVADVSGLPATDELVLRTLSVTKAFDMATVDAGSDVTMTFTLDNLDISNGISNIRFDDELDNMISGATVSGLPVGSVCGGANISVVGGSELLFQNGTLGAGEDCTFEVTVSIPCGTSAGSYTNVTGDITVNGLVVSPPAMAGLMVNTAPEATFTVPADTTINCDQSTNPMNTGEPTMLMHSCCTSGLTPNFTDMTVPGTCPQESVITRTWTVTDCNGVVSPGQVQTITVQDTLPPILMCPINITITCSASTAPSNTGNPSVMDNCDMSADASFMDNSTKTSDGSCSDFSYTITRTWTATDACSNATSCDQTINVVDTQSPSISCPANTTINCDESNLPANTGSASGTDNCDANPMYTYNDASDQTSDGSCSDFSYTITRTWQGQDACGNMSTTCEQMITVQDVEGPSIMCPVNATIDCDESILPANTGEASGTDNCDPNPMYTYNDASDQTSDGSCTDFSYTITRTWQGQDVCGNMSTTCDQTITVQDMEGPSITCPPDTTVACDVTVIVTPDATGTDNCDPNPVYSFTPASSQTSDGSCSDYTYTLTYTWQGQDACGNMGPTCDQIINVVDTVGPSIMCPGDTTVACDTDMSSAVLGMASGTDNCDANPFYSESDISTQTSDGSCTDHSYSITRTWQGQDACLNMGPTCDQIITVVDTVAPVVTCPPTDITVNCDETVPSFTGTATANDNCDANPFITSSDLTTATNDGSCSDFEYVITRSWFAFDACSNVSVPCVQTINVEDNEAPSIMCPPNVTVECDSIAPVYAGMASGTDNCDPNPTYTFNDASTATNDGSCTDHEYTITRTWQGADACGNQTTTCTQTITVEDNTAPELVCPPNTTVECDDVAPTGAAGEPTVNDNCDGTATYTFSDVSTATSDGSCTDYEYTITRTFNSADVCGNQATACTQTITVEDNTGPTISCPANLMVECDADLSPANTGMPTGSDNCDVGTISFTSSDVSTQTSDGSCTDHSYTITRTWEGQDVCGNQSSTCDQIITVDDTTPPTPACSDLSIDLDTTGNLTITPAQVFDASSSMDNCSATVSAVSVSPSVFDCQDEGPNTVTLTAEDVCGNTATCTATVTIGEFLTIDSISAVDESCAGAGNGSIEIFASALGGQIGYSTDNGANYQFGNIFNDLTPGTYNVRVKVFGVAAICEKTAVVTVGTNPNGPPTWYKDFDDDGYSDGMTQVSCTQPADYKLLGDLAGPDIDCDDNDPLEFPGQEWYPDADGDDYGGTPKVTQCERPAGHFAASELTGTNDCNDNNAAVNPGATEICNGIDDNCDGSIDEGLSGETFFGNVAFTTQAQIDAWPDCFTKIDGNLTIAGTGITSLAPLGDLSEVTGSVTIQLTGLTNMTGLDNLTTVGGGLTIYFNSSLTSLTGLQSLATVGGNLSIYYNFLLVDCCPIKPLVSGGGVTGAILVFFNAVGCNSLAEILACPTPGEISNPGGSVIVVPSSSKGDHENVDERIVTVFPNPASSEVNVLFGGLVNNGTIELMDVIGRKVHRFKISVSNNVHTIDVSNFNHGVYLLTVKLDGKKPEVRKIVIE